MGDQKTDLVVMQDNFNALYRRRLASSQAIPFFHKVLVSLTNMTMQDTTTPWLHDSFWHKITLMFFRVLPSHLIRSHFDLNQKIYDFYKQNN